MHSLCIMYVCVYVVLCVVYPLYEYLMYFHVALCVLNLFSVYNLRIRFCSYMWLLMHPLCKIDWHIDSKSMETSTRNQWKHPSKIVRKSIDI